LYADTSSQSQNNVKFLAKMLTDVGITVNPLNIEEASPLIAKIYNATTGKNSFDFAQGTPAEGESIAYVIPFMVSNAFSADSKNPLKPTGLGKLFGTIIALGNHGDTKMDDLIYAAQAEPNAAAAKTKWVAASEYAMSQGYVIPAVSSGNYVFVNKMSKLNGIGKLRNPDGKTFPAVAETKGIDYTGIYKG
jgi:ABC-type transport system substrate-binding protein